METHHISFRGPTAAVSGPGSNINEPLAPSALQASEQLQTDDVLAAHFRAENSEREKAEDEDLLIGDEFVHRLAHVGHQIVVVLSQQVEDVPISPHTHRLAEQ